MPPTHGYQRTRMTNTHEGPTTTYDEHPEDNCHTTALTQHKENFNSNAGEHLWSFPGHTLQSSMSYIAKFPNNIRDYVRIHNRDV